MVCKYAFNLIREILKKKKKKNDTRLSDQQNYRGLVGMKNLKYDEALSDFYVGNTALRLSSCSVHSSKILCETRYL